MDNLRVSINKIFKGAINSVSRFPAAIISAIIISIVAIIRITMDWEIQKTYSLLLDSIQLAFLFGAAFSMAAVAYEELESEKRHINPLFSNISGIILAIISFLILYFFGGIVSDEGIIRLSNIASARVAVAVFLSAVSFMYIVSYSKTVDSFSDSFFIAHRAFAISAIYGLVIMIGVSGVLGAFQALVYREMSFKVYQYLGVAVGFLTYTMFLGYFPSFRANEESHRIKSLEEQPRFIFVLFSYILVPIMLALTVVLLLWSVRVVLSGLEVSFAQLSSIASSYVIIGIWLHIMVSKHNTKLSEFYKLAYPFSAILVLAFEAWALVAQLNKFGLKTMEYSFLMIWIFAAISIGLLIFLKDRAYRKIAIAAMIISIIWVLPFIGYEDITFNSQVSRLEKILNEEDLLEDNNIVRAEGEIEKLKKGEITDAVDFIAYSEKDHPIWFKEDLNDNNVFKETFGFEKVYGLYPEPTDYYSSYFMLESELIDISQYPFTLNVNINEKLESSIVFSGKEGEYDFNWTTDINGIPTIIVKLNDNIIIEENLKAYLDNLELKYPLEGNYIDRELPFEDMSFLVEGQGISILLIFDNVNINHDIREESENYYVNIQGVYIKYN